MSNPNACLALLLCMVAHGAQAQSVQTLADYIVEQRAAMTPRATALSAAPIGKTVRVPELEGTSAPSSLRTTTTVTNLSVAPAPVPPALPYVLGILVTQSGPAQAVMVSELGGAEWIMPEGEALPNSAWRVRAIHPAAKTVTLESVGSSTARALSCKQRKTKPCVAVPRNLVVEVRL
jgi:hypothetical protein